MTLSFRTTAERLLLDLCRARSPSGRIGWAEFPGGLETLRELEALASRHGVEGLVYSRLVDFLSRIDIDAGGDVRKEAEAGLSRLRLQTAFRDMEQDRVLAGLARAGVDPLVLKGGALRRTVFSPLERTMGDLDILVDPDEVTPALEALTELGYQSEFPEEARAQLREHHHEEAVAHPRGFLVEVHWGLTRPGHLIQLDPARIRARSVTIENSGSRPIRIPCAEDMLIHTVSQSEQESVQGLRRLIDLDRIARTPGFNWDDVRSHADETGLHGFLCVTVRLAHLLLDTPAPGDLLAGRELSSSTRRAVAAFAPVRRLLDEPGLMDAVEFHLFRLWCMRPGHRRVWLRRTITGESDPLHWVWEGQDNPDEGESEGTTGLLFTLKLAAYQSILSMTTLKKRLRDEAESGSDFWLECGSAQSRPPTQRTPA